MSKFHGHFTDVLRWPCLSALIGREAPGGRKDKGAGVIFSIALRIILPASAFHSRVSVKLGHSSSEDCWLPVKSAFYFFKVFFVDSMDNAKFQFL